VTHTDRRPESLPAIQGDKIRPKGQTGEWLRSPCLDIPPVFDTDGDIIRPTEYESTIPDCTLVAVRGSMKT